MKSKLLEYIVQNNPEVIFSLQASGKSLSDYMEEKIKSLNGFMESLIAEGRPLYDVEKLCLDELTKDLRPSKYNYIHKLLEEEFEVDFARLRENGALTYEIVKLIKICNRIFEAFEFTEENEQSRVLRYAAIEMTQDYFQNKP